MCLLWDLIDLTLSWNWDISSRSCMSASWQSFFYMDMLKWGHELCDNSLWLFTVSYGFFMFLEWSQAHLLWILKRKASHKVKSGRWSGTQIGESALCGKTLAYPHPTLRSISGTFHWPVKVLFILLKPLQLFLFCCQYRSVDVRLYSLLFKWLITKRSCWRI